MSGSAMFADAIAAKIAPELAPEYPVGAILRSRSAARNPACAKKPKKPDEKTSQFFNIFLSESIN